MSNYQATMFCPQHKGQSKVTLARRTKDPTYSPIGQFTLEPEDEFWDEDGKLHLHYTYFCSKGHEFSMPCEWCAWGKVMPPPLMVNGAGAAAIAPPPSVAPPPPPIVLPLR